MDNLNDSTKFNNRINLTAIKKEDPYAKEIVDFSSYVAFYKYKKDWEKTGIEGSFFVYSRGNVEPKYSIFINNTKSQTNHVEPISKKIEFQNQPPFLLYRNEKNEINGFWFGTSDCERIHELLTKLIKETYADSFSEKVEATTNGNKEKGQTVDIFSMLSKAQEEYQKGNAKSAQNTPIKPAQPSQQQQQQQQHPPQHQHQQMIQNNPELARQFSNMYIQKDIHSHPPQQQHHHQGPTPIELSSIFAAAQNPKSKNVVQAGPMIQQVHTVDEIEKHQQRVFSPSVIQNAKVDMTGQVKVVSKTVNGDPTHQTSLLTTFMNTTIRPIGPNQLQNAMQNMGNNPIMNFVPTENAAFQQFQQVVQQKSPQQPVLVDPKVNMNAGTPKPTLLPPTVFLPKEENTQATAPVASTSSASVIKPEPLTQNQLLQALNYLLQNDPDFMKKVHEAYLKIILNNF